LYVPINSENKPCAKVIKFKKKENTPCVSTESAKDNEKGSVKIVS